MGGLNFIFGKIWSHNFLFLSFFLGGFFVTGDNRRVVCSFGRKGFGDLINNDGEDGFIIALDELADFFYTHHHYIKINRDVDL